MKDKKRITSTHMLPKALLSPESISLYGKHLTLALLVSARVQYNTMLYLERNVKDES